jgi:hypothetical protein
VKGALLPLALVLAGCPGAEGRDVVPTSRDVQVRGAQTNAGAEGYEYVARRPLAPAVVALAESRGLDATVAHVAIDRLADALDTCATEQGRKGGARQGAARVVAQIEPNGTVAGTSLRVDPGTGVAESAALCLVAPLRMLTFPPIGAGRERGIAIEALWGAR